MVPGNEANVGIISTTTNEWSTVSISSMTTATKDRICEGTAVGTKVYFAPHDEMHVGVFDTYHMSYSIINITVQGPSLHKWCGAATIGTTVYFGGYQQNNLAILDVNTHAFHTVALEIPTSYPPYIATPTTYKGLIAHGTTLYMIPWKGDTIYYYINSTLYDSVET